MKKKVQALNLKELKNKAARQNADQLKGGGYNVYYENGEVVRIEHW